MYYVFADGLSLYNPSDVSETSAILNPVVSIDYGKSGSFEFDIPMTHSLYDSLLQMKTIIEVHLDDEIIFRGRIITITRQFDNLKHIVCEGILGYLNDTVQKTFKYEGTIKELFGLIIDAHNARAEEEKQFVVGEFNIENRKIVISGVSEEDSKKFDYEQVYINSNSVNWNTTLEQINTNIITYCGGYLRARYENGVNYIDMLGEDNGNTCSQTIEFGVNITGLDQNLSIDKLFTVLVPIGNENLTIASVNNGSDELVNEELLAKYGRIMKTNVFDSVTKAATLLENAQKYMEVNCNKPLSITVNAVDMHLVDGNIESIHVGDRVHILSRPHDIDDTYVCSKVSYDMSNPANNEYTFGNEEQSLTQKYRKNPTKNSGGGGKKAAEEETKKQIGDFYNAYVNFDEDTAKVDIAAIYKQACEADKNIENARYILENVLGINLDAPQGKLSITNMRKDLDDAQNLIKQSTADIYSYIDERASRIELNTTTYTNDTKDTVLAQIELETQARQAAINLVVADNETKEQGIKISLETLDNNIKNTKTTIDTKITNIESEITYVKKLIADEVTSDRIHAKLSSINKILFKDMAGANITLTGNLVGSGSGTTLSYPNGSFGSLKVRDSANSLVSVATSTSVNDLKNKFNNYYTKTTCDNTFLKQPSDGTYFKHHEIELQRPSGAKVTLHYWGWKFGL